MIHPVTTLFALLFTLTSGVPWFKLTTEQPAPVKKHNTLQLVTMVMRHGERAPVNTYPNDPYANNPMKPFGWGQLTKKGRKQQYSESKFMKEGCYEDFLGSTYHPDIFHLQSTGIDRTKMSAMLIGAGMWRPNEEQTFRSNLPWQPVTLSYQNRPDDTLLLVWNTCPKYTQLRSSVYDLPEVQKAHEDYKQLFEELTNYTGMRIETIDDASSLYSTLLAEDVMELILPEWTKNYYPDKLVPLYLYELQLNTYNDEFRRLRGGPMLKKFINDMVAKKNGTLYPKTRKMFVYVGHDSTITTLLDTMHIWYNHNEPFMPYYNVMTMIELHEDKGNWNVMVYLRNATLDIPDPERYLMTIPGCTAVCPLDKFIEILKPMVPEDWDEECKVGGDYTTPPAPAP